MEVKRCCVVKKMRNTRGKINWQSWREKHQIDVEAGKAVHVGDDQKADKVGANAVGINCWFWFLQGVTSLGINYGQLGNNLQPPDRVLDLLSSLKLTKARIYDTNPQILTSFANSDIELIVTVENQMLPVVMDPHQALQWVSTHIMPFFPATKITGIAVGNEIFTDGDKTLLGYLVRAIVGIHGALVQLGLDKNIQASTSNSLAVLQESYPPSAGSFKSEVSGVMSQLLQFLSSTGSPFWINAYPYFAYKDDPNRISLDYVLFNRNPGMVDPYTKLHYDNMLYAQVDAVVYAMFKLGNGKIEVRVSETGWPSKGDSNEIGATVQNAAVYNRNLLRRKMSNKGTPLRQNKHISNTTPPCGKNRQENCVIHRPPANEHQRPCNPSDHCRGVRRLTGSESMSKAQVSAATKQFGVQDHTLLRLGFAMDVGSVLFLFQCLVCFWYGVHV
ncbi:hypothetical protein CRYUN_Cryun04dG0203900 [Craigia yunnanensis]